MTIAELDLQRIAEICRQHNVASLGVFGSTVHGKATPDSDLDLLVEFSAPTSLLGVIRLERELSEALGVTVDLLTEPAISPHLRERILSDLQIIYAAG